MKLNVNKDLCLGCGACCATAPDIFEIGEDGLASVKVSEVPEEFTEDALDAKDGCPTSAIEEVNEESTEDTLDAKDSCPTPAIEEIVEEEKENN